MKTTWPHAPQDLLGGKRAYIVTARTYRKEHLFTDGPKLEALHNGLLKNAAKYSWRLQAWAVFSNHYHLGFLHHGKGRFSRITPSLPRRISQTKCQLAQQRRLQERTQSLAQLLGQTQSSPSLKSYYARLNYVHQNAVHHGLVKVLADYPIAAPAGSRKPLREHRYRI